MPRSSHWLVLVLIAAAPAAAQAPEPSAELPPGAPPAMAEIDRTGLLEHAAYLASDELGGRYTSSEGQRKAAEYIAKHFESLGLAPLGDKPKDGSRSYYQAWPLNRESLNPEGTSISFGAVQAHAGFGLIRGKGKTRWPLEGPLSFCGDGSKDLLPRGKFKTKIPVIVLTEPDGGPRRRTRSSLTFQRASAISRELKKRGARAALYLLLSEDSPVANTFNGASGLTPNKPMLAYGKIKNRGMLAHSVPGVFLGRPLALKLMEHMGLRVDGQVVSGEPDEAATINIAVQVEMDKKAKAVNVVAVLEGADKTQSKEAVIYSAHMDHMGMRLDGDAFNGADDNASGTAGLLEIAAAFAKGERPIRSVIFLAVSGEEEGLWGSKWFAENPTWPMKRVVANVNIDMIGRSTRLAGPGQIAATPSFEHAYYNTMVRTAYELGAQIGLKLTKGDRYYTRSDHYNFARADVPVVFFCDGEHEDYHKVTDHVDLLDGGKMERVARLAYWTGWEVAQDKKKPKRLGRQNEW
ncbi:MAG: M28 family peptidase [Planctomycetota bacterium]